MVTRQLCSGEVVVSLALRTKLFPDAFNAAQSCVIARGGSGI